MPKLNSTLIRVENTLIADKPFIPDAYALTIENSPTSLVTAEWLITALTYRSARLAEDIITLTEKGNLDDITEYVPLWGGCIHDMQEVMIWLMSDDAKTRWKEMQFTILYPALMALGIEESRMHWTITQTRSAA